jgi:hypothetical protein
VDREEELERGARRGKDGRFRKMPVVVANAVHDELVRRRLSKAFDQVVLSVKDCMRHRLNASAARFV